MLEQRIEELTVAVKELTKILSKSLPVIKTVSEPAAEQSPPTVAKELPSSASVTYDDVKKATIELSKVSKPKAIEVLAHFGVKTAKELPEDTWTSFVKLANGALDEVKK